MGELYSTRGWPFAAPLLLLIALAPVAISAAPPAQADPVLSSIYPAAAQCGSRFEAVLRGTNLSGGRALLFDSPGASGRILSAALETNAEKDASADDRAHAHPVDLLTVEISVSADAEPGSVSFRILTPRGISNKLALFVTSEHVLSDSDAARPLGKFPAVINGRIAHPGDVSSFTLQLSAGQTFTIEASSFSDAFDPSVAVYEPGGSWFNPQRLNLVASNDEPLSFPGLPNDARLVERFPHAGTWIVRVAGFHGSGGPDCVYRLRIVDGVTPAPSLHPLLKGDWEERQFTRALTSDRIEQLSRRSAADPNPAQIAIFRAAHEGDANTPMMTLPGVVEGRITQAARADLIHFKLSKPEALAIEVETPEATLPRFNPVVRLMDAGGSELATNVYTKLNNNGLYMMKMIEAKTTLSITAAGEYTLQIRDITTNGAGEEFRYRVLVRPQIPHVGKTEIVEDHINIEPGSVHPLIVATDREEGFSGYVMYEAEGLPEGVSILPGIEDHADPPPLPNGGRLERYVAKQQRATVMIAASPGAHATDVPAHVRLVARLSRDGRLSDPIPVKEILLMVVPPRKI